MTKFTQFIDEKVSPIALKIGGQKHLQAIRSGVIATLPLTIAGSLFAILLNLPVGHWGWVDAIAGFIEPHREAIDILFRYTMGILALYASFGIASSLAKHYELDALGCGIVSVMGFLVTAAPPIRVFDDVEGVIGAGRYINIANLNAASLFAAIVVAIVTVEIYRFVVKKKITLKMPDGVPPEISNSFMAVVPASIVLLLFWFVRHILNFNINEALSNLLMPLQGVLAGNSLLGGLLTVLLITFFWLLGIHGPAILGPVIRPFWNMSIAENMEAFAEGVPATELPNIFTEQFLQWYVWIGGAGTTLALVCLFMFSKSKFLKSLGRVSFLPGLFNVNEPIIFGAPIVMNPILAVPFILAPVVTTILSYILTRTNVVPMMMAQLPFTLPAPLAAWMSTNWSIMAAILVIINFIIALLIYYPFFKIFEKQQLAKEEAGEL